MSMWALCWPGDSGVRTLYITLAFENQSKNNWVLNIYMSLHWVHRSPILKWICTTCQMGSFPRAELAFRLCLTCMGSWWGNHSPSLFCGGKLGPGVAKYLNHGHGMNQEKQLACPGFQVYRLSQSLASKALIWTDFQLSSFAGDGLKGTTGMIHPLSIPI